MLKIYNPLDRSKITQGFGENRACAKLGKFRIPYRPFKLIGIKKGGTCPVKTKPFYKILGMKGHNGIDFSSWVGQPIYFNVDADCDWWVRNYTDMDGGKGIDIFSDRPINIGELPKEAGQLARRSYDSIYSPYDKKGNVFVKFRYHHISKSLVTDSKNQIIEHAPFRECKVKFGDLISLAGNTGSSSGPHTHVSMKIVANNSMTLDRYNGYNGAVDFTKYYEDVFVGDVVEVKKVAVSAISLARTIIFVVRKFINRG